MAAALFTGAGVALVTLPGHRESRVDFPAGLKRRLARMAGRPAAVRAS
jgi:hypothetical protein